MKVTLIPATDLSPDQVAAWSRLQASNPALASPFFCPEFTLAIAGATNNIFVGVLHDGVAPVGFFPFALVRPGFGKHLEMCDYQGLIASPSLRWDAKDLLRGCGLKAWDFDHLLASQEPFQRFHRRRTESPVMDLSHGFEAYKLSLSDEGKRQLQKAATSTRKVERELGPLRFVYNASDGGVMQTLFEWKARKHAPLPGWARNALETLRRTRSERFSGFLSALYAGEQLIAAHFGMRSRTVWHLWFPAYNPQFRQYGPGILLMLKMAEHSAAVGINTMDLGKGTEEYKRKYQNASVPIAEGAAELVSFETVPRMLLRGSEDFVRKTPVLLKPARVLKKLCRTVLGSNDAEGISRESQSAARPPVGTES